MVFLPTDQLFSRKKKRNCEVNGRELWCVCPWSTSVSWLQDSGGVSELKMDFSSLPQPTAGKKDRRPQLIGFVNDWGTAERWLQSDRTWWSLESTKEFPKVMQMLLLTQTWREMPQQLETPERAPVWWFTSYSAEGPHHQKMFLLHCYHRPSTKNQICQI